VGFAHGLNGLALFPRAKEVTMTASAALTNPESAARSLLQMVLAHLSPRREFAVQLWDGDQWPPESNSPAGSSSFFEHPTSCAACSAT